MELQKNKSKKRIVLTVIILIVLGFSVYNTNQTTQGKIKIGVIAPLSGFLADYGEEVKKGVLAVQDPNIEFIFEDDKCEPKEAVSAFKKLTEVDKVHYVIGPACGSPQEAIVPLLKNSKNIVVVPSAASRTLYETSGGNFYNMQYALEDESKFIAEQMYARGYKKVVLISYQNAFSKTHYDSFKANYKGTIVHEISYPDNTTDVSSELVKIRKGDYDAIFSTDIAFFFGQGVARLTQLGIKAPIFSQYAVELPAVRELVEGVYYSFPGNIADGQGAVAGLSLQSAELLSKAFKSCGDTYVCVKEYINKDGFDTTGAKVRELVLKKIERGSPVVVK
ncbi:MAG: penicillin-binding protein activator [Candidatus Taylorbacteria bacterium]|nr:penicillin-binding protein activator [Candidatus Taylorbacteria bacterium]